MVRLRAVGECLIEVGEGRVGPDAEMAFALLLVLTLGRGRPLGRQWLVDLLWPATSERRARHNLRQTLYKLRQLGVPAESEGHHIRIPIEEIAPCPLLDEEGDEVNQLLLDPDHPFGEFLAGYTPQVSGAFSIWLDGERDRMHARLRRAILALMLDERRRGGWGVVEMLARKCLQLDPLNEEATLALAEAIALTGSKRSALAIIDGYLDELGGPESGAGDLRLPATVVRKRIAERLHPPTSLAVAESCFVGRGDSMAFLGERLQDARRGSGRAVLAWGEAGMGKSRLVSEFSRLCILDGIQTARVACLPRDLERPLSVFMDVVPMLLALPGALGCSPESMEYLRRLTEHDPEMTEPSEATREAELLFAGVRQAILDLVDAVSEETALVLCVEDVHWLDGQSWRVLRELIEWSDTRRVLVLLTSRQPHPTPSPPEKPARSLELHRLGALDQDDSLELFEAVTVGMNPPVSFRDWCIHVAEGNPFFVRALAIHWMETGELGAPTSLADLVDGRIARLGERALLTLQACAVLGKAASLDRLELVLEHRRHELVESVDVLAEHGLLAVDGVGVPCRHDLIAQSALDRLAQPSRRLLHRCAAEVLQAEIERSQSAALLWECAQQWQSAGEGERALALVKSCGGHLLEVGLPGEAAEIYEKALELCRTDEERLEMLELLAGALKMSGAWGDLCDLLPKTQDLRMEVRCWASQHHDDELLLLEARWRTDHPLPSLLVLADACSTARNAGLLHRLAATALALVFADNLCDRAAATRLYERAQVLGQRQHANHASQLRTGMIFHNSYGDIATAVDCAEELISMMRAAGEPVSLAASLRNATTPYRMAGRLDDAFACAVEAYEMSTNKRMVSAAAHAADILATLNLLVRDVCHAETWYKQASYWVPQVVEPAADISIRRIGARIALERGDPMAARALLRLSSDQLRLDQVSRRRTEGYALFVACALAESNEQIDDALLDEFAGALETTMPYGGQDYAVSVLFNAYIRNSHASKASSLLGVYATARRERSPSPDLPVVLDASVGTGP